MKLHTLCALGLVSALLAACGGGGGTADPESVTERGVPARALASPEAFSQFVGTLKADEQGEPMPLGTLMPPTSETAEPVDG